MQTHLVERKSFYVGEGTAGSAVVVIIVTGEVDCFGRGGPDLRLVKGVPASCFIVLL